VTPPAEPRPTRRGVLWLSWISGAAILAVVIVAALHASEGQKALHLAERAKPWWLVLALGLQAATYLAQGEVFRGAPRASGSRIPFTAVYELSLAKLFMDQALPSAGLSSSVLVAKALERRDVPRPVVAASVVINYASYHAAYAVCLLVAVAIILARGLTHLPLLLASAVFVAASIALAAAALRLSGPRAESLAAKGRRFPVVTHMLAFIKDADPHLARSPRVLGQAVGWQAVIFVLDAATIWVLVRSLGAEAPTAAVFASFMVSTLLRTVGIVPGGLGTFEAASVWTLKVMGVAVPLALASTLLFRGLSFWLPMVPGLWISRRITAGAKRAHPQPEVPAYWKAGAEDLTRQLGSGPDGLSASEAAQRLRRYGPNQVREHRRPTRLRVLLNQFRSPLILVLVFAAAASAATGAWVDAVIVLVIVLATAGIGYWREYSAETAAAALQARTRSRARVVRDGKPVEVPTEEVVPGDVALLSAGSLVAADGVLLEAADLFVNEATLTGESFPVAKRPGPVSGDQVRARLNSVFLGTSVHAGTARCLVVATGLRTELGAIAERLSLRPPETEFDRGIRRFGYLLTSAMVAMVLLVFTVHVLKGRRPIETLLFSVALAVGLSPELLPAILGVNLARGARMMAGHGVLVRRVNAIENLGSIDVLCTDKTGTLTEGVVKLEGTYDAAGSPSDEVRKLGVWNAALGSGVRSALDEAILQAGPPDGPPP
jgi:Mg2+-importing ATPase